VIAALVLAAGRGARFSSGANKLLEDLLGRPVLRHVVDAALASRAHETIVVTGHDVLRIEAALAGLPLRFVYNPDYAEGLASSLRVGVACAGEFDGVLVLLGDMPGVAPPTLDRLIDAFETTGAAAAVPTHDGRRGNPVLIGRSLFPSIAQLSGDAGARGLLRARDDVIEIETGDPGVLADVDTPEDLAAWRRR